MAAVSSEDFRKVMASFAAGVTVVTTVDTDGTMWGLTVTAFSSLSLDPPLCLVCIDRRAGSHAPIGNSGKFAVSMLSADQEALSSRFASRVDDKFDGVAHRIGTTGCPILQAAVAAIECEVVEVHAGGDHDIFIGRLCSVSVDESARPLVYWRGRYGDVSPRE